MPRTELVKVLKINNKSQKLLISLNSTSMWESHSKINKKASKIASDRAIFFNLSKKT